jgi:hypothetical protein
MASNKVHTAPITTSFPIFDALRMLLFLSGVGFFSVRYCFVTTIQDSTSSRLLPGSSSMLFKWLHALILFMSYLITLSLTIAIVASTHTACSCPLYSLWYLVHCTYEALHAILQVCLHIHVCVQAGCTRAKSAFWLSLHIFSLVHRHMPCKGWDVVSASHPFLFVCGQPSRLFVQLPSTDNASSSCT